MFYIFIIYIITILLFGLILGCKSRLITPPKFICYFFKASTEISTIINDMFLNHQLWRIDEFSLWRVENQYSKKIKWIIWIASGFYSYGFNRNTLIMLCINKFKWTDAVYFHHALKQWEKQFNHKGDSITAWIDSKDQSY